MARGRTGDDAIVIVGGGLAGQRCAEALRRDGYGGALRMVCAERHRPYDRPPLSKELLANGAGAESVAFRAPDWYETQSVDLLLGLPAVGVDLARRRIELADGTSLGYRQLVVASGSRPRTLPMLDRFENVSVLRSVDDCLRLREVLASRPRLSVIGGGFIGQEVAATARSLGAEVTIIEAAAAPLISVLGAELGGWFVALHEAEGVEVLTSCAVAGCVGNGRVESLQLSNGRTVATDHVLVGVGVVPQVAWLAGSGLAGPDGVPADSAGRTAAEGVMAIGDAAATFDPLTGAHVGGSHWEAAGRQAVRAARAMLGLEPGPAPLTSFWTDQYGIRIQYLGHARLADRLVLDGDPAQRDFIATFLRSGEPVAGLIVGRPRALSAVRKLIEKGTA
jgi:3-phenylpropionate/trans-cinnamate dioxygenase ferredoxin reductase component